MPHSILTLGPVLLQGSLHETIWGGRQLGTLAGKVLPDGATIGESWETAVESAVRNPPYAGSTLGDLVDRFGVDLVGTRAAEIFGVRFPLLTKFIDARDRLSVQVHPDDAYAAAQEGGKLGKTEAWYVLHGAPGARLVYGLTRASSPEEVRAAIAATRLEELLHTFEARAGDVIYVPAGTVHAIGAGVVLYELQEYSDVTYRLYDYGRLQSDGQPRALHVEKGLAVMNFAQPTADRVTRVEVPAAGSGSRSVLIGSCYFVLEELRLSGEVSAATDGSSCHIVSTLDGVCDVETDGAGSVRLALGDTVVLPARLGAYRLRTSGARLLRSYVPLESDAGLLAWRAGQSAAAAE